MVRVTRMLLFGLCTGIEMEDTFKKRRIYNNGLTNTTVSNTSVFTSRISRAKTPPEIVDMHLNSVQAVLFLHA